MLKMKNVELTKAERETAKAKKKLDTAKNAMKKLGKLSTDIRSETASGTHSAVSFKASHTYVNMLTDHATQAQEQIKQLDFIHKEHVKIRNTAQIQKDGAEKLHEKNIKRDKVKREQLAELKKIPRPNKRGEPNE